MGPGAPCTTTRISLTVQADGFHYAVKQSSSPRTCAEGFQCFEHRVLKPFGKYGAFVKLSNPANSRISRPQLSRTERANVR